MHYFPQVEADGVIITDEPSVENATEDGVPFITRITITFDVDVVVQELILRACGEIGMSQQFNLHYVFLHKYIYS